MSVMAERTLIPPGRPVRVLFCLTGPSGPCSTARFFATHALEAQVPPATERFPVTIRVAPYVVGGFGEAFLLADAAMPLAEGAPLLIWEGERLVADALVAEIPSETDEPESPK